MTDSMALSTDTDGTTETEKTWYKMLFFVSRIPNRYFDLPQPQNGRRSSLKPNFDPSVFFSFSSTNVTQKGANMVQQGGVPNFEKHLHSCDVHFAVGEKQILETRCIKLHALFVDPLRDFSNAHTLFF